MVNTRRPQTLGAGLVIISLVFLTFALVSVDADHHEGHTGDDHSHDHEGTQGYGQECLMAHTDMKCKPGKGFHCSDKEKKAICICLPDFEDSSYLEKNDTCVAKLNKRCRISQVSIPCDDPNAVCTEKDICECNQGKVCSGVTVPIVPGFTVLMTLAIATGVTYLVM